MDGWQGTISRGLLMKRLTALFGLLMIAASLPAAVAAKPHPAASGQASKPAPKAAPRPKQKPGEVLDIDWKELLPEAERARYSPLAPPPIHDARGEGSPPAVQTPTFTVNQDLAGLTVRLPGFIVPLDAGAKGTIREFLLVPYVGACIHVPPPPPNQMLYVKSASGIALDAIHEAYWVTGKMRIESRTTPLGAAAYAVSADKIELYKY
jgi:hypothetical protein